MRKKRTKKGSTQWLIARLDKVFGIIVRARGECRRCLSSENLQCAHILSRSYKTTRWNLKNAFCLCRRCHKYFTHHPLEWEQYVIQQIGIKKYEELKKLALNYQKLNYHSRTKEDYEKLLVTLESTLAVLT